MKKKQAKPPPKSNLLNANSSFENQAGNSNIAQRQAIIRQILNMQALNESDDAPVALACVAIKPNGQTDTLLINIEPEHVPIVLDAGDKVRKKMLEFFKDVRTNSATVHYLKKKVRATDNSV